MERIATKWRKHLAVGVSPQLERHQVSLATEWRQQFQPVLSPLRGFDSMFYSFLGLTPQAKELTQNKFLV